jgi:hypothetical protein
MKKLFFLFYLMIEICSVQAMQTLKQRISQINLKKVATTSLAVGLTGIHYGLAYNPLGFIIAGICQPVDELEIFVKEELTKRVYTAFDRLKIIKSFAFRAKTTPSHDYLFFDSMYEQRLEIVLKGSWYSRFFDRIGPYLIKNMQSAQEYKNTVAGIIQHEGSHLINKDSQRTIFAELVIIGAIEIGSFFLKKRFKPINNFWIKQSVKIPTGMAKLSINLAALAAFCRYREQEADEGINDDIALLIALKNDMEREMCFRSDKPFYDYIFFQTHPSHGDRFERFTRRIKTLEFEEQLKKSNKKI